MHIAPYYHRSIFDDIDTVFDDLLGNKVVPAQRQHAQGRRRNPNWTATVQLSGYRPHEVHIERAPDNSFVKVLARRDEGDDYSEARRTVQVPDNVDRNRLEVDFTQEGVLVMKAPYLQQIQEHRGGQQMMPYGDFWGGQQFAAPLTQEMRNLENEMWSLTNHSFPGSMSSQIVRAEDGSNKLNVDFDLSGYKPEEVTVNHEGSVVTVEAKHDTQTEHGHSYKHFKRAFTLPNNVQAEELTSRLLPDGRLRLAAPCKLSQKEQSAITNTGHDIPIKRATSKK
jgi:HSP20 family molecular chaperone IbpA